MNQFIFKSRWIALAFTAMTLVSVYTLVGNEDSEGLLGTVTSKVAAPEDQLAEGGAVEIIPAAVVEEPFLDDAEFVDDEELIDDASGSDPSSDDESEDSGSDSYENAGSAGGVPVIIRADQVEDPDGG